MTLARDYRGRTVVITGAAGGLGQALALAFAAEGAHIVAIDVDGSRALALAVTLRGQGIQALGIGADVTSPEACAAAIGQATEAFGGVDVLVNNAGISARCLLGDMNPSVLDRVMSVNFFGAASCTRAALGSLRERQGQIIAISSVAGFSPLIGRTAYSASKHALHGFFDSLRSEVGRDGVDVMLVCPSFIAATGIERAALGADGEVAGAVRRTTGGDAAPDEVAAAIVKAARRRRRLCLPSGTAKLAWWFSRLMPVVYERLMLQRMGGEFFGPPRSPT